MNKNVEKFTDYESMQSSAKNWDIHCAYQLHPKALIGVHRVVELDSIILSYTKREGGFMHDAISPPGTFSIAIILECESRACFDKHKLHKNRVLFFDDLQAYNFMSKSTIEVGIISISKLKYKQLCENLSKYLGLSIYDEEELFKSIFQSDNKDEDVFIKVVNTLIKKYPPEIPKLTKGEKIALSIRDEVYKHMDGKIRISTFAKKYEVSEQTLQNSFKSLFGFTPNFFLRLLKLNLVHYELKNANHKTCSVSKIAMKWGFIHMGRFSHYYFELFLEKPSFTLARTRENEKGIETYCVKRKEEI